MTPSRSRMLALVNSRPEGISTRSVASRFNAPLSVCFALLADLLAHGLVNLDRRETRSNFIWRKKCSDERLRRQLT